MGNLKRFYPLMVIMGLFACEEKAYIEISNSFGNTVNEKLIYLKKVDLRLKGKKYIHFRYEDGEKLPAQYIDTDQNGEWDEVALLVSIDAKTTKKIVFELSEEADTTIARTQAYLGLSENRDGTFVSTNSHVRPKDHVAQSTPYIYQYEGPGWESDKVAFRTYFDSRNGKDIFGKTTSRMVTDEIGLNENYHELREWGMDILKVGNSLGAGALAMLKNDSLYRLGDTQRAEAEILVNGSLMSQLALDYDGWEVAGKTYNIEDKISIFAGMRWYQSEVSLDNASDSDTLVTGIVNLHEIPAKSFTHNGYHITYSHGAQGFMGEHLGMAIIVPEKHFAGFGTAPKEGKGITNTHTAFLKSSTGKYTYCFYAGWEKENPNFKDINYFEEQVKLAIDNMETEIIINYK